MNYICYQCQWSGLEQDLEYDTVETCVGSSKIEICPKCGSYEVHIVKKDQENDN